MYDSPDFSKRMSEKYVGLAHIGVYTKDVDASIAFYEKLGFKLDARREGPSRIAFVVLGSCTIELIQPGDPAKVDATPADGRVAHIALEVQNIEEAVEALKAEGIVEKEAKVNTMPDFLDGVKNIFFRGPSDEYLELFDFYNRY